MKRSVCLFAYLMILALLVGCGSKSLSPQPQPSVLPDEPVGTVTLPSPTPVASLPVASTPTPAPLPANQAVMPVTTPPAVPPVYPVAVLSGHPAMQADPATRAILPASTALSIVLADLNYKILTLADIASEPAGATCTPIVSGLSCVFPAAGIYQLKMAAGATSPAGAVLSIVTLSGIVVHHAPIMEVPGTISLDYFSYLSGHPETPGKVFSGFGASTTFGIWAAATKRFNQPLAVGGDPYPCGNRGAQQIEVASDQCRDPLSDSVGRIVMKKPYTIDYAWTFGAGVNCNSGDLMIGGGVGSITCATPVWVENE